MIVSWLKFPLPPLPQSPYNYSSSQTLKIRNTSSNCTLQTFKRTIPTRVENYSKRLPRTRRLSPVSRQMSRMYRNLRVVVLPAEDRICLGTFDAYASPDYTGEGGSSAIGMGIWGDRDEGERRVAAAHYWWKIMGGTW